MTDIRTCLMSVVDELKKRNKTEFAKEIFSFVSDLNDNIAKAQVDVNDKDIKKINELFSWFSQKNKDLKFKYGKDWEGLKAVLIANMPSKRDSVNTIKKLMVMFIKTLSSLKLLDKEAVKYRDTLKKELMGFKL